MKHLIARDWSGGLWFWTRAIALGDGLALPDCTRDRREAKVYPTADAADLDLMDNRLKSAGYRVVPAVEEWGE
jgi:hypothetical protein